MILPTETPITPDMLADDSPAHLWPEAHNPANQWMANHKGRIAAEWEVFAAGDCARAYVWAAMDPEATRERVWQESARAGAAGRPDVAKALREGYARHAAPRAIQAAVNRALAQLAAYRALEVER